MALLFVIFQINLLSITHETIQTAGLRFQTGLKPNQNYDWREASEVLEEVNIHQGLLLGTDLSLIKKRRWK